MIGNFEVFIVSEGGIIQNKIDGIKNTNTTRIDEDYFYTGVCAFYYFTKQFTEREITKFYLEDLVIFYLFIFYLLLLQAF